MYKYTNRNNAKRTCVGVKKGAMEFLLTVLRRIVYDYIF
jgi:hypothetical protein